jgi:exosortase E/protease (VPEID-CTERM system)
LWTIAWLSSGTATITAWGLLLVPWSGWLALFAGARMSVAAGAVIGTIGWAFGFVTQEFWIPLSRYTFACVDWLLRLFYAQTVSRPTILLVGTPSFRIGITPQCSGFEGVGLLLAFMTLYLWFCRRELRFPRALVLLPLGAIVAWLANVVRIVALIAIGTAGWRGVAAGGFHSQAGWVLFNVIALGFVMMAHHAPYFRRPAESISSNPLTSTGPVGERTTALLGPFIVITATAMITGLFSAGFDWLYPVRVVTVSLFLWTFRREYLTFRWSWSWWSLGLGLIAFLTWIALVPDNAAQKGSWPATLRAAPLGWAAAWLFFRSVGYVLVTPLAEELAFRGFVTKWLDRADLHDLSLKTFSWWALVVSSLLFGALHGSRWLPATIAGMSFCLALYRRGSIADAVWAHATTNGMLAIYACATGQWSVWS